MVGPSSGPPSLWLASRSAWRVTATKTRTRAIRRIATAIWGQLLGSNTCPRASRSRSEPTCRRCARASHILLRRRGALARGPRPIKEPWMDRGQLRSGVPMTASRCGGGGIRTQLLTVVVDQAVGRVPMRLAGRWRTPPAVPLLRTLGLWHGSDGAFRPAAALPVPQGADANGPVTNGVVVPLGARLRWDKWIRHSRGLAHVGPD